MNYKKIYDSICGRAKFENRTKGKGIYYEAHHIIPKCIGGSGKATQWRTHENIVLLTAREHFLCHRLLCEIYPKNIKLASAFWGMCNGRAYETQRERYKPSSRVYEIAKKNHAEAMKTLLTGIPMSEEVKSKRKSTKGRPGTWTGKTHSEESKQKMRQSALARNKPTQETINKRVASCTGLKRSEETKKKISNSNKNNPKRLGKIPWNKGLKMNLKGELI
jgi:hypothetical protein